MQLQVNVTVIDPKFTKGCIIQIPNGTVFFVEHVISTLPVAELQGRGNTAARVNHQYILVVQRSPVLRPGVVVLATEGASKVLSEAQIVKKFDGSPATADTLDLVFERTRGTGR